MNAQKVEMYLMVNGKYFKNTRMSQIKRYMLESDDGVWSNVESIDLKDPSTAFIVSLFGGIYGIDRFYIGDVGLGIGKLLTCGGLFIWAIIDWFLIQDDTKERNMQALYYALKYK